jgi:hypothetical protein
MTAVAAEYTGSARLVMPQDEIDDNREEWLRERRAAWDEDGEQAGWRLTASEMAAVLGMAPQSHSSAYSLYWEKVTGLSTFQGSDRTDLGLYLENLIASRWVQQHPHLELGAGGLYVSKTYPWLGATFDRIAYWPTGSAREPSHPAGPVQLKSWANSQDFGPAGSAVMPLHLRIQLLTEMIVLGTDTAWMPVCFLPGGKVRTLVIERDKAAEQDMAAILQAGELFLRLLEAEQPPDPDFSDACLATQRQRFGGRLEDRQVRVPQELAARYLAARAAHKAAERRLKQAQAELREQMGTASTAVAGVPGTGRYGPVQVVCTRSGGPVAGFSVAPKEWREAMNAGDWKPSA